MFPILESMRRRYNGTNINADLCLKENKDKLICR